MIVPTVCFVTFVVEEGDNDCSTKVIWHYTFFPYAGLGIVQCIKGLSSSNLEEFCRKAINSKCFAGTGPT